MNDPHVKTSKFLSLVLRHRPEAISLALDSEGWASVDELIDCARKHGRELSADLVHTVVITNDKQRFALSEDGHRIRANQGHSISVDLKLPPEAPPDLLFHGTVERFVPSIKKQGLLSKSRSHVHLSPDEETAVNVGKRRGAPVILRIRATEMHDAGHQFFLSENQVWLTAAVPPEFIDFPRSI